MNHQEIRIRKVNQSEHDLLQRIGRETFQESFQDITPEADMETYLQQAFNSSQLQKELEDKNSIFYFAELHGGIIGYGKINLFKPPYNITGYIDCMEIQRIYFYKKNQGGGGARLMMNEFFKIAQSKGLRNIWLSTGSFNNKALSFYEKFGFKVIGDHDFPLGNTHFTDVILMKTVI